MKWCKQGTNGHTNTILAFELKFVNTLSLKFFFTEWFNNF